MAVDPVMAAILEGYEARGNLDMGARPIDEVRAEARAGSEMIASAARPEVDAVHDRTIPGSDCDIPARVYRPEGDGPFGICLYYHGGGFTIGDLDSVDHICRAICNRARCLVVSIDYRLAPEHPFPAAVDDAWAGVRWALDRGHEVGGDPSRVVVAGDSAGANLAAVVALRSRDDARPDLVGQVLVYPGVDRTGEYPSSLENGEGYLLTSAMRRFFAEAYLPDGTDLTDWRVSPLLAETHAGVAPALVVTAEYDPLRDEGEAYAEALEAAGVETTLRRYDGMIHGFLGWFGISDVAAAALDDVAAAIEQAIG